VYGMREGHIQDITRELPLHIVFSWYSSGLHGSFQQRLPSVPHPHVCFSGQERMPRLSNAFPDRLSGERISK